MKFRNLKADEIDVRIQSIKQNGLSLLLYKDARCDMNILDETVGEMNWQRKHLRDNQNCIVSIWDKEKKQWIDKEDTGTESMTEKEKGLASDSFKRACFNWGIGRELYTSPFIWISSEWCEIQPGNGKYVCYDKFEVSEIETVDGKIKKLVIINSKTGKVVFGGKNIGYTSPTAPQRTITPQPKTSTIPTTTYSKSEQVTFSLQDKDHGLATAICDACGSHMYFNEGTTKTGKHYTNLKCELNPEHVIWYPKPKKASNWSKLNDMPDKVVEEELSQEEYDKISNLPF